LSFLLPLYHLWVVGGCFGQLNVGPAPPTNYHTTTTVYKVNRLSDPLQSAAHLRGEAANRQ